MDFKLFTFSAHAAFELFYCERFRVNILKYSVDFVRIRTRLQNKKLVKMYNPRSSMNNLHIAQSKDSFTES